MHFKLGFTFLIAIFFLFACQDDSTDSTNYPSTQSGVIVAGSYSTGGNEFGAYWTDYNNDGSWERT